MNRRVVVTIIAAALMSTSSGTAWGGDGRPLGREAPDPGLDVELSADDEYATFFRSEFGLEAGQTVIANARANFAESETFGLPLSAAEEALMQARLAMPGKLGKIRAYGRKHADTWGGMWLTYPSGGNIDDVLLVNVGVTSGVDSVEKDVRALLPKNVSLAVRQVAHTQQDLDAVVDLVLARRDVFAKAGTAFHGAATLFPENLVEIDVSHVDDQIAEAIGQAFGTDIVSVVESSPAEADACSRANCGPPWRGGVRVAKGNPLGYCTAGFGIAYYSGIWNYGIFTAGHCGTATWREAEPDGTIIGTTTQNHFHDADPIDVQVIPIASANRSNQYLDGTAGCINCTLRSITVTQGHDADEPGDAVCNHGAFSGTKCGSIKSTNAPLDYLGENLLRLRRASYSRKEGDSGGPVTSAANTAVGSHTHYKVINGVQYAYYTHIWEMENITGWDVYHG